MGLSPIDMARLLLYKHKINNMGDHRLLKLAFNSSQNWLRLKWGCYKDTLVKRLEIYQNIALQNINNITNIVTSKFKEKLLCGKDLEAKRKLRYYKEVINPTLEEVSLCFNQFKEKNWYSQDNNE